MRKAEAFVVQGVVVEGEFSQVGFGQFVVGGADENRFVVAVELVADDRVADRGEVYADLMLAARVRRAGDECGGAAGARQLCARWWWVDMLGRDAHAAPA